jgi:hypothetical protein
MGSLVRMVSVPADVVASAIEMLHEERKALTASHCLLDENLRPILSTVDPSIRAELRSLRRIETALKKALEVEIDGADK